MKVAVTYENGEIFGHFGHTEQFKLYDVENNEIIKTQVVDTKGSGHGALAGFLEDHGVDTLICGGIGFGAKLALSEAGIRLFGGVTGDADAAVHALIAGTLDFDPIAACSHHADVHGGHSCAFHDGGHNCGSHEDGGHGCGERHCTEGTK